MTRSRRLVDFSPIDKLLEEANAPQCSKDFIRRIWEKNGRYKMSPSSFETGTDSRAPRELGIVLQKSDNSIHFASDALEMINRASG